MALLIVMLSVYSTSGE